MICCLYSVPPDEMRRAIANPSRLSELLDYRRPEPTLSLEKSWHGLHFTLTGSGWEGDPPLNFLLGGLWIDDDRSESMSRAFDPAEVARLDEALAAITPDAFARRFDVAKLAAENIYPSIWDEPKADLLAEYGDYFEQAKAFIAEIHRRGDALLVSIG